MVTFTFGALLALVAKLAVGIGGATGVAKGMSWFNKKTFNSSTSKRGVLHAIEHETEKPKY